jgi:hypothetical protein
MKYDWIKNIPEYLKFFSPDQQKVIELIGFENYMTLHEHFGKTGIYFSDSPITALKKAWAIKNKHIPYNEAARTLDVSTKSIYNWRETAGINNFELFEEGK